MQILYTALIEIPDDPSRDGQKYSDCKDKALDLIDKVAQFIPGEERIRNAWPSCFIAQEIPSSWIKKETFEEVIDIGDK